MKTNNNIAPSKNIFWHGPSNFFFLVSPLGSLECQLTLCPAFPNYHLQCPIHATCKTDRSNARDEYVHYNEACKDNSSARMTETALFLVARRRLASVAPPGCSRPHRGWPHPAWRLLTRSTKSRIVACALFSLCQPPHHSRRRELISSSVAVKLPIQKIINCSC